MSGPDPTFLSDSLADCDEPVNARESRTVLTPERIREIGERQASPGIPFGEFMSLCDLALAARRQQLARDAAAEDARPLLSERLAWSEAAQRDAERNQKLAAENLALRVALDEVRDWLFTHGERDEDGEFTAPVARILTLLEEVRS